MNSNTYEVNQELERFILVGISTNEQDDTEDSLLELKDLVDTAGAVSVGSMIQNREHPHPGTYLGKGKIEELREMIEETHAIGIVCDDELSPAQLKNLEEELDAKVIDRTLIILDIFAKRASTSEGKIQVELAQLRYRSSRLIGLRSSLSRLGGASAGGTMGAGGARGPIGTRGPGEKKLEMDRRLIKDRITQLSHELSDVISHRDVLRNQRKKNRMPIISIVGYTNAGKSTLLNSLTSAHVLEEDKLFATLDPTTRNLTLPSGQEVLITDTVGFIRKLPHHLIDAFRSTLEEAKYADIILHVVDASNSQMETQMHIVYETLSHLGVTDKPILTLFNKQDKIEGEKILKDLKAEKTIPISAKHHVGLKELLNSIEDILRNQSIYVKRTFPFGEAGKIQIIRKYGQLLKEEYVEDGIFVEAYIPVEVYGQIS